MKNNISRPMFGGLDSELRAAFGKCQEPKLSYSVKKSGATLSSQLAPSDEGLKAMVQSLGDMVNTPHQPASDDDGVKLEKYSNMQKFMTSALCKSESQGNNIHDSSTPISDSAVMMMMPDFSELETFSPSNIQHRYQNSHHCGFDDTSVDVKPYAVAIYDFVPQFENELGFKVGDVIFLVQHIDEDWVEGDMDGVRGIFPGSYVNIVVDCVKIQDSKPELDELEMLLCDSFYLQTGAQYKVNFSL